ncbi:unnamed protein product [Symbiodinium necroappetens]|uniref:PA14 domain-containing protein n=1 Tax=Symbiodinium necroappetens TaxID=1628268 RepID=A0A812M8Q6_9DINO|nr:unnamed protein product [Symbiodinium necroappetens]
MVTRAARRATNSPTFSKPTISARGKVECRAIDEVGACRCLRRCKGFLVVRQEGNYKFYTTSDDGSNLYLNGEKIVDNDGCHGQRERSSSSKLLSSGAHELIVDFCEARGGERLYVHYEGPDTSNSKVTIPKEDLKHRKAHPQGWGGECFFAARWRARPQCKLLNKCPAVAPAEIEVARET